MFTDVLPGIKKTEEINTVIDENNKETGDLDVDIDDIEIIVNEETGECFASISALARMCRRNESTIRSFLTSRNIWGDEAKILTSTGMKTSRMFNEKQVFQTLAEYNTELLIKCAEVGIRVYLHRLAGFTFQVKQRPQQQQTQPQLRTRDSVAYIDAAEKLKQLEKTGFSVALIQLLQDNLGDELATKLDKSTIAPTTKRLVGVAQRAEELGLPVTLKNRSALGKFVKTEGLVGTTESRLCNGTLRPICVYEQSEILDFAIRKFFETL